MKTRQIHGLGLGEFLIFAPAKEMLKSAYFFSALEYSADFFMFQLRLFDDIVFFEYFLNAFKSSVDLFDCVCRHKAETNQSVLRRNGW